MYIHESIQVNKKEKQPDRLPWSLRKVIWYLV